ncbi:MAG: acyl carrier protein [Deferribacteres bacterium]|nr:acyl carrier protein [candidate division KSB1 bacterium]MCB9504116.1 acyl carrier protein [Deferribacteres bacterium]
MTNKETIRKFFGKELDNAGVGDDDSLLMAGIIDSLKMMDLITFLEKEFGVSIDDDELMPENFDSIDAIESFVAEKKAA